MKEITCDIRQLDVDWFLNEYWQKQPLVIRQALPGFESPLSPEELAGLACEEDVNSRIVIEKDGEHPWQPIYGPMDDDVFSSLPATHWTLLVNDVEKHLPEFAGIVDRFRFIPEWRLDDLMISYAPEGGSVGPHMDLYDVFILQAQGHRRWDISTRPVDEDNQIEGTPLRIQRHFEAEFSSLLNPGDLIYIPPAVSHHGVATDDCMSYSIGYRAPAHGEMVSDYIAFLTQDLPPEQVYRDRDLQAQLHANEITDAAIDRVRKIFQHYLDTDNDQLRRWLGRFVSDPQADVNHPVELAFDKPEQLLSHMQDERQLLMRNPASRFAFLRNDENALLYIDRDEHAVSIRFAESLCDQRVPAVQRLVDTASDSEKQLLLDLFNSGKLILMDEDVDTL